MISQLTQESVAEYASNAEYIAEPLGENYTKGAVVGKTIPAKWWNWLFNAITKRITQAFADNTGIFNELKNTVVDAGLTPDATDDTQVAQSIKLASEESLRQFFLDKQKPYGKDWVFHNDTASISVPDEFLTDKNVIDWSATVERVDNFWFARIRLKGQFTDVGNREITFYTADKGAHWYFLDSKFVISVIKNGSYCYALCLAGVDSSGSYYSYISLVKCSSSGFGVLSTVSIPSGYEFRTIDTTVASGTLVAVGDKYVALLMAKTHSPNYVATLLGAVFDSSIDTSPTQLSFSALKTATSSTPVDAFEPSIQAYTSQLVDTRYYVAGGFCDANGENWDFSIAENLKSETRSGQDTRYCFDIGRVSIPGGKHIYVRARWDASSEQTVDADYAIEDAEGNLSYVKESDVNANIINIFPNDCILASRSKTIEGFVKTILLKSTDGINFSEVFDNGANIEIYLNTQTFKSEDYYFCGKKATRDFVNWITLPLHRLDSGSHVELWPLPKLQGLLDGMYPSGTFLSYRPNSSDLGAPSKLQFNTVHPEYEGKQLYMAIKGISSNFYDTVELINKPASDQTGLVLRSSFADEESFYAFLTELKGYSTAYEVTTDSQGYITQLKINKFTLFTIEGINRVSGYTLYLR